jgi:hypothetical protein
LGIDVERPREARPGAGVVRAVCDVGMGEADKKKCQEKARKLSSRDCRKPRIDQTVVDVDE